ncbi:MAG: hypothetical protein ACXV3U_08650 [Halobacteriota archaeon]
MAGQQLVVVVGQQLAAQLVICAPQVAAQLVVVALHDVVLYIVVMFVGVAGQVPFVCVVLYAGVVVVG